MKKLYYLVFILAIPALFILFTSGLMSGSGSPGAKTGSPGDGGQNCTQCHSGTAISQEFWILGSMGPLGYEPGVEYTIVVVGIHPDAEKFGFEATAEDAQGNKVGTITIAGMPGMTQLTNNNHAVTHTIAGTVPLLDTASTWMFNWTAPAVEAGDITFYAAINAANGNGNNSGDQIYLTSFTTSPSGGIGINEVQKNNHFSVFPNPSDGIVRFRLNSGTTGEEISIIDLTGKTVEQIRIQEHDVKMDLGHLQKGIYLFRYNNHTERVVLY